MSDIPVRLTNFMVAKALDDNSDLLPSVLPTSEAAKAINRKPQTLRKWACLENGPIRPIRINGRLAWRVSDLAELMEG